MEFPSMRVDGRTAFVTGAGSGLGQAIAIALAQNGADVAITELPGKEPAAEATAREIEKEGGRACVIPLDVTEQDWDKVLDINLKGLFFVAQAVAKQSFIPQASGKIVNMASIMGAVGFYYRAAYASSKAGVVNLTRVLALEWAKHNIRVNAVAPTFILTPLTQSTFDDPALREDLLKRIPLGRVGQPEDVVGSVVFLASPAADLITGHTLLIDGGWTAI